MSLQFGVIQYIFISMIVWLASAGRLPAFFSDYSEVVFNAMIERSHDNHHHLVIMFMGHKAFQYMPQAPILMMNASTSATWGILARSFKMNERPARVECQVTHNQIKRIATNCAFLPATTSIDTGFNGNIELLRCDIPFSLAMKPGSKTHGNATLQVSLHRRNASLLNFQIPIQKRQTGYGLALSRRSSHFDPWHSDLASTATTGIPTSTGSKNRPIIYLCSSVIRPLEPFRADVALLMLLEFVEHNLVIGFDHIFLGIFLDSRSVEYRNTIQILGPYIKSNKVSVTPLSLRGVNDYSGLLGLVFIDDYTRYIHQNQCLYMAKTMADYVIYLHASEFLTLTPPIMSINELVSTLPAPLSQPAIKGSVRKTPCFYKIYTLGVQSPNRNSSSGPENDHFISDFYHTAAPIVFGPLPAFAVAVVPTRNIGMISWHDAAVCSNDPHSAIATQAVTPADSMFVPMEKAVVYFYRSSSFDPWQLNRQHYLENNHTSIASRVRDSLLRKGIVVDGRPDGGKLYFKALGEGKEWSDYVGGGAIPMPRGRHHMLSRGFVECQSEKGCHKFGDMLAK